MRKIKITADITPADEGGYIVYCPELDITTEGESVNQALAMIEDAASGYIEVVGIRQHSSFILRSPNQRSGTCHQCLNFP
jgi:predicted RNase H-like HicB family nuclease